MNPALVDVVLPDPELQGEDGRLRLRRRLLVGDGEPPQLRPPARVAHRLKGKGRKGEKPSANGNSIRVLLSDPCRVTVWHISGLPESMTGLLALSRERQRPQTSSSGVANLLTTLKKNPELSLCVD